MSEPLIIALMSAIVAFLVALITTWLKNKVDLIKTEKIRDYSYAKSLFDERVKYYPELYSYLSDFAKLIDTNQQTLDDLKTFKKKVDEWNSKHSIFFSTPTVGISGRLRYLFGLMLEDNVMAQCNSKHWEGVRRAIGYFENSLKAEIGVYTIKPVQEVSINPKTYDYIDELTKKIELLKNVSNKQIENSLNKNRQTAESER